MPNVFITNTCNLRCKYCFAKGMLGGAANAEEMTLDEIKKIATFVKNPEGPSTKEMPGIISLLGGEPTLHSQFRQIIDYLLENNFVVKLFSNGTFNRETADFLAGLPAESVGIILNINKRENYSPTQWENIQRNLSHLNKIITLGLTIFEVNFDFETVLNYITTYGLRRDIRLGISMPIVGASNAFVTYEQTKLVAQRLLQFAERGFEEDITLGFDCGFTLCMFTRKELGRMKKLNVRLNFTCDGAIDIGKHGRVWRCFPLYSIHNTNIDKHESVVGIKDFYNDLLPVKVKGISGDCGRCKHYQRRNCSGGCYGYELQ